jgi:hypothetical protein
MCLPPLIQSHERRRTKERLDRSEFSNDQNQRQLSFETRNTSKYKVGNNILTNRLSSLNMKKQL